MAQEIPAGLHHRANETFHLIGILSEFLVGHGNTAERHFEFAFDIGEQAETFLLRHRMQRHRQRRCIDAAGKECLEPDRFASHRNDDDILVGVQTAGREHGPGGVVDRSGKAADADFLAAQLRDRFVFRPSHQSQIGELMRKVNVFNRQSLRRRQHTGAAAEQRVIDLADHLALQRQIAGDDQ